MANSFTQLENSCRKVLKENWTSYEASKQFGVDYNNMCAYYRGSKKIPYALIFSVLDYCNVRVVCFKSY